ncbi:alpha/beta hydrolase family protein [Kineococcus xinjiangensis]|uniref:Alpha/beta hydrolase family protein n=1 Tax=Kineococcus xinjiangensis TaxID=512762 RepID=A0A2S6IFE6_9ACTN|nr:alpha/beta hydrolase [Kineococcus xinjiangensis]PPK92945.1 alpha/beta hydrolase family protein [Kineococcus xinjiangensis]
MSERSLWWRVAAAAVVAGAVGSCSAFGDGLPEPSPPAAPSSLPAGEPASDPDLAPFYGQRLEWAPCGEGAECAQLSVPVDHADPAGPRTSVSVLRVRARGEERLGSLVLNPGGPGGSGVAYAAAADRVVTDAVRDSFDVVGFDPRGVGRSAPLQCLPPERTDAMLAADPTPDEPAEADRLAALAAELGRGCAENGGALAAHVDTESVARDLDVLRAALGDEKLTYLGKSYGTFLGAAYAELFPQRVGRLVLDGAMDPSLTSDEVNAGQAAGFERALRAYVEACLELEECPLSGTPDDGARQVRELLERLDAQPLPTGGDRELTQGLAYLGIAQPLYAESLWPQLTAALTAAERGDGGPLLALADAYAHRRPDGTYADNATSVIYAVNCLDRGDTDTRADIARDAEALEELSPTFGRFLGWSSLPCSTWPFPAKGEREPVRAPGADPILVVGTTRDSATPYEWAVGLAEQLDSGHLLTYEGDGHTAYRFGSRCVDTAVDAYLLAGELPEDGARCE